MSALPERRSLVVAVLVSALLVSTFHLLLGHHNINLRDEGYLWYGVLAVQGGEVPFRDFQSYDPGRYYWCAALSTVFGDGLVGLRASVAVFQAVGMVFGLLVLRRVLRSDAWMLPAGFLLLLWMFPRHKLFEQSITLVALWSAVRLIELSDRRRFLVAGVVVGLAAFFGRNHGLYLASAFGALALFLMWRAERAPTAREVAFGLGGIVIGYLPMLAMLALVPGFGAAFGDALFSVLERGANLPKDYRWPWSVPLAGLGGWERVQALALDASFLLPVAVLPAALLVTLRTQADAVLRRGPLIASAFVGAAYVHHFAVCSDLPHLAQAYAPVLVATLALAALRPGRVAPAVTLGALLLVATGTALEGRQELKRFSPGAKRLPRVTVPVGGDELVLTASLASPILRVEHVVTTLVGEDEEMFIAPTMPMWYPLLEKRTPVWWIYFLWPAPEEEQRALIDELKREGVNWALVIQKSLNDRAEYDFANTYPLVWRHFTREKGAWERVQHEYLPNAYRLFRRRAAAEATGPSDE